MFARLGVLLAIAFRNLFTSWLNLVIGLLILAGTVLLVVGGALLDSVDHAMSSSIVQSLSGDLQIYSSRSKEKLELFGGVAGADPELSPILDFQPVQQLLQQHPNVERVVPMGTRGSMLTSGNTIDVVLERLREAVAAKRAPEVESLVAHVRHIVELMKEDRHRLQALVTERASDERDAEALERVSRDAFWKDFGRDPLPQLDYLESRLAPQMADGDLVYVRYLGTDVQQFQAAFPRFRVVEGSTIPPGHHGFLFARESYDNNFKLKAAWRLDRIKEARDINHRLIATDDDLKRMVRENRTQTREIALQLDPRRTALVIQRLQRGLPSQKAELEPLLSELLDVTDADFDAHYALFYDQLAKDLLELYRVRVGDPLTLTTYTQGGYTRAVNLRVWGVFEFAGLEKSPMGGLTNLMDLMSFRELYGYLTPEKIEELQKLKSASGVQDVSRENAEDALFGSGSRALTESASTRAIDESRLIEKRAVIGADPTFDPAEQTHGIVLHAAVILKDPRQRDRTMAELKNLFARDHQELAVLTWQEASGLIGQFVRLARMGLYAFVSILFVVTLVVINNAMMMATLQRVREIGTLRAIGAQRGFVLLLVCVETLMLGALFGGLGLVLGSGVVAVLHAHGIGATSAQLYFFFSGPRLFPVLHFTNLAVAFGVVLGVSLISTLYPAVIATRVSPLTAMQTDE